MFTRFVLFASIVLDKRMIVHLFLTIFSLFKMEVHLVISFKNLNQFNNNVHNILILLSSSHFSLLYTLNVLLIELIVCPFIL